MNATVCPSAAKGRVPAVNNDYEDVVVNVAEKLTVLSHLFEYVQYAKGMASFRQDTFSGLCLIIDGCIDELKTIV